MDAYRRTLANGLTAIVAPTPHGHHVHAAVFVRMGSTFESPATSGLSHFVEHLLFQGNSRFADSAALCAFVEERGGEVNAQTTPDFTQVYLTLHSDYAVEGIHALAALTFGAATELWDVERERQIVLHEYSAGGGDPDAEVRKWLWPNHPLGYDVSGTPDTIQRFTAAELRAHYTTFFRPGNVVVVVSGRLDPDTGHAAIAEAFGDLPDSDAPLPEPAASEAPTPPDQHRILDASNGGCGLLLALPACGLQSPDVAPLQAGNFLLGGGLSSRLFLRVREQAGLAYDIGTSLSHFRDRGYFVAHASCQAEKILECTEHVLREVWAFGEEGVTTGEMERMRRFMHCQMDYRADDPVELASWYGVIELLERPETLESPQSEAEQIANLSREEINTVLRRWLRSDAGTVICHTQGGWWHRRRLRRVIDAGMHWGAR